MLKKTYLFCLVVFYYSFSFAQKERVENLPNFDKPKIHYGFYLGLNQNDFKIAYNRTSTVPFPDIEVESSVGFNVGLIADLRLHNNVNLRLEPGLISNTKTLRFNHIANENQATREVGNTYLHVPLIFKFSTNRLNNIRPYVLSGVSYDYNFSSNESNSDDNFSGEFRQTSSNFMYEVGIGVDFYLPYFKFSPSIRGIFAINNELKYDNTSPSPWTDPISFMGTRGLFIHFAFE
ncbi:type IX secretion/gliding motility protein PorT/SprT [Tenacibaculum geojense]|uniref:Porin family protein n=1 Tax=Tenacibaculum geojense TaxID=915352 RepID=A0ABW3JTB7_9FLAO